jgi:hypothetical protein
MRGWKNMIRQGICAGFLGATIWLTMPTEAMAQSCTWSGLTCEFSAGSYSTQLYIPEALLPTGAITVNVDSGTTVTVNATAPANSSISSPTNFLNLAPAGTTSGQSGADAPGFSINNHGSLTLQNGNDLWAPNGFFAGLYSVTTGGQGYGGGTPGDGGNTGVNGTTTQPLAVTNDAPITISLPLTELQGGAALFALAQGGDGGCSNGNTNCSISESEGGKGGDANGVTANNTGSINVTVGTEHVSGGGHAGFGGIEAQSLGGNAGYGNNGPYGGNSAAATVTNSAPVIVNYNWSATPNVSSSGVYGIQALSQGGNASGSKGGDGSQGGGWGGSVNGASVTLAGGGDVTVIETGTRPQGAPAQGDPANGGIPAVPAGIGSGPLANIMGAGVAAQAIGGNGGNGEEKTYPAGGGYVANGATISITDANVTAVGVGLAGLLAWSQGGAGGLGATENNGAQSGSAYSTGGAGGMAVGTNVSVTTDQPQNVLISTNGDDSPALAAFALGGVGGKVNPNTHDDGHNTGTTGGAGGSICADPGFDGNCHGSSSPTSITLTGNNPYFVNLTTNGGSSPGIYVVNQGGDGGYGGDYEPTGSHGDGGAGGAGGSGSDVTVTLQSAGITTRGSASPGIIAQSQGGVGGGGGYGDGGAGKNDGGNGGAGGNTGNVTVSLDSASSITTFGTDSSGIVAQTLSGAGGNAGPQGGHQGAGGNGGAGGTAGSVTVTDYGNISTWGNDSRGIVAQSLSGAGGPGGSAGGFFNNHGGTGGSSGTAGTVTVNNYSAITTSGSNAQGILAQSIGGGGGAGGWAAGFGAVGGTGALAADGNSVSVNLFGTITTSGISAAGVLGQSIGGGGGDGGGASGGVVTVGGSAGGGGNGGGVSFSPAGGYPIKTNGDFSPAVLMQSIGGGGGNAGNASALGLFTSVAIGGSGGVGGKGGSVTLDTSGMDITTVGTKSPGLVAQSIGGGGGMGGNAFAAAVGVGYAASSAVGGSGGVAGNGGTLLVNVQQETIATGQAPLLIDNTRDTYGRGQYSQNSCTALPCNFLPVDSYGVVVQSIGGGGGLGGQASAQAIALSVPTPPEEPTVSIAVALTASIGGTGGSAGDGGLAQFQLSNGGKITTSGQGSTAVLVQSIGGGGGAGGDSSALSAAIGYGPTLPTASLDITGTYSVGGNGGNGGNGGQVVAALGGTVSNATPQQDASGSDPTSITTYGDFADGIKAQSIGGGGGDAGSGSGSTQFFGSPYNVSLSVTLGSKGGTGGIGGPVTVALYPGGGITTYGSDAIGILAQSIGGGGGTSQGGSYSLGIGVKIPDIPDTYKLAANVNVGTTGGSGNTGGDVTVTAEAPITTRGGDATGILAQSVGGGGGVGGSAGADASADNPVVAALAANEGLSAFESLIKKGFDETGISIDGTASISVGGKGGSGGTGGSVTVNLAAPIMTQGDWANGIVAQSIGGGGGKGGTAVASGTGGLPEVTLNADVAVGGSGGTGNQGGTVTVNLDQPTQGYSSITTAGFGAAGIVAQSIGGGGGIGADGSDSATGLLSAGGSIGGGGGGGGDGETVTVTNQNPNGTTITTAGAVADGVVLQSIGGSGGVAGRGPRQQPLCGGVEGRQIGNALGRRRQRGRQRRRGPGDFRFWKQPHRDFDDGQ